MVLAVAASATTTYSNIENMSGWSSCTTCAGKNGSGPTASFSMLRGISSPSLDGSSAQFNLGGSTPYANALWWKQLGGNGSATHFVYDLYFYLKNSTAPQALEFDINQSTNGHKYIFGHECDFKGSRTWRVWSPSTSWTSTGIGCSGVKAYTWNHLTLEVQRVNGQSKFIAITLNGNKHYVNRAFNPQGSSVSEINVAFQMDLNSSATDYSVWLDKVKLTYW
jgi:hypothetical protein